MIGQKYLAKAFAAALAAAIVAGKVEAGVMFLSGPDSNAGTYSSADLAGLATGSDTVTSDGLTGISLWGLLAGANSSSPTSPIYGGITTSTPAGDNGKNAILRYYLLATGSGGAQSVISLGEIDPNFGGTAPIPALVAFKDSSNNLLLSPELIVPGASGRDVLDLSTLQLLAVPALPAGPGGISSSVSLSGFVTHPGSYTKADLQADFTPVQETVSGDTYIGVLLWTFLNPSNSNTISQYVVTAGTDGYEVVLSLAELDPSLGGNPANLLPYADTGTDFPLDGVARTILPSDNKHGRWVSNLDSLGVAAVPEPETIALLVSGLVTMAMIRRRRNLR
jgi:hypothetical protein